MQSISRYISFGICCLVHLGRTWKVGVRGRVHVFPYVVGNPAGPVRVDAQTRSHARKALSTDSPVSQNWWFE